MSDRQRALVMERSLELRACEEGITKAHPIRVRVRVRVRAQGV